MGAGKAEEVTEKEVQEDGAEPPSEMMAALRGVLTGMHIHTLSSDLKLVKGDVKRVHKDLHKIEDCVLDMVNNLEERVTSAFANHQDMIDAVYSAPPPPQGRVADRRSLRLQRLLHFRWPRGEQA